MFRARLIILSCMLLLSQLVTADDSIGYILKESSAPDGVVFEVLTHDEDSWPKVLSYINTSVERLHKKFPELPIVIVSHGLEQFALLKESKEDDSSTHAGVQSLLKNNIKVEVCGTFAGWKGYDASDFPDYVTVVDQAPTSIQLYEHDGYEVVIVTEDEIKHIE